jgi:hypothetical protein
MLHPILGEEFEAIGGFDFSGQLLWVEQMPIKSQA